MSEEGYEVVFEQETRQAMGLVGKVDGCGLFWQHIKFHLVESYSIEFNELLSDSRRLSVSILGVMKEVPF